ncbi:group II intron reverse transcriptase/maturase [Thermincola ferriacetica]
METKLARIREIAERKPDEVFTSVCHLLNEEMLMQCHRELDGNKATGVDQVTKADYEKCLYENISSLVERLKKKSYRPQPVRRTYIPKGDGKSKRPLGIPAHEDKIVQMGLNKILQAIYEPKFLDLSYGFRPGRSCHDALRALTRIIERGKINYIVEVDIRGFFDHVDHEWLMKFIGHRINDPSLKRLIVRFLKAGIMEDGIIGATEEGTPQGAIVSPTLANIYLHYVLDLWFSKAVKKNCRGQAEMIRYADDFVCCFQHKDDAEKFLTALINRLAKFNLKIAEDKTKMFMFGRYAEENHKRRGLGKPQTFDFLGFTHYCGKSRNGKFRVKHRTSRKKFKAKVKDFKEWIKSVRNCDTADIMRTVRAKLLGHYRYYGITDNSRMIAKYMYEIIKLLFKWLNRRSQRKSFTVEKFRLFLAQHKLPTPKIYVSIYG